MNSFQKNAWLWNETNVWIRDFLSTLPAHAGITVRAEDIFASRPETLQMVFELAGSKLPRRSGIDRILRRPLNAQTGGDFPDPGEWSEDMRQELREELGQTAREFGYSL